MDINNLKLEKFETVGSKSSRKISIMRSSSFGFPPAFLRENNLASRSYATLFYDPGNEVIGIQFTEERQEKGSFKLSFHKKDKTGGASFGARSFFKTYNLNPNKINGKFDYKKEDLDSIGEVFLIDLKSKKEDSDYDEFEE